MNNHIKTCPCCQGDGVVKKEWEDIKDGDYVRFRGGDVRVIKQGETALEYSYYDKYWLVTDGKHFYNMFREDFAEFVKD